MAKLVEHIRAVLAASTFLGEGYRKGWAKLRHRGIRTSRGRVLRLMREHELRAPTRSGAPRGPRSHEGTIIPPAPKMRWGTDLTGTWTTREGSASVLLTVDHHTAEILGIHAAARHALGGARAGPPGGTPLLRIHPREDRRRYRAAARSRLAVHQR